MKMTPKTAAAAVGAAALVIVGAAALILRGLPTQPPPFTPEYREITLDDIDQLVEDLAEGRSVMVRTKAGKTYDGREIPSQHLTAIRSHGPMPEYLKKKTIARYENWLSQFQARIAQPRDYENVDEVVQEAQDLMQVAGLELKLEMLWNDKVVFGVCDGWPQTPGWEFHRLTGQSRVVDKNGATVQDLKDGVWREDAEIIFPIKLADHPAYANAVQYFKDSQKMALEVKASEFNGRPFEERKRLIEAHIAAANRRAALFREGVSGSDPRVKETRKDQLPFDHFDRQRYLAILK